MTTAVRRALARRRRDENGFTLIELVVAMMVIGLVLISLVMVQTSALVTTAQTKQRTQATALANATMEQLRALPWLVLVKGLNPNFATAAGGDPNIASGLFHPLANTSLNEVLVTDASQGTDRLPLSGPGGTNKTLSSDPSVPGILFTTRVYVTRANAGATALTLSVLTSWTAKNSSKARSVLVRSQAYAPDGGCGDRANQPFLGACQAILSSEGGASGPLLTLSPSPADPSVPLPDGTPLMPGLTYATAAISSVGSGAASSSQQSTTLQSRAASGDVVLTSVDPSVDDTHTGAADLTNKASNDVGSQNAAPANPANTTGVLSATSQSLASGNATLTLTPGSGATGTAAASLQVSCQTGVPAGQGCGAGSTSGGSAASAVLTLGAGTFRLADVATGPTSSFAARFTTAGGNATVGCATLSGPGCGSGGAQRTISGTSTFAKGPWTPSGAAGGLVTIAGYSDGIMTERGLSQRTTAATVSRSGTLSYWNGTGYTTVTLSPTTAATYTTPLVTWVSGGQSVTAKATVTVTAAASTAQNADAAACQTSACTISADTGTIAVSVTYVVTDGATVYGLSTVAGYGTSHAAASFKAALGG